MRYFLGKVFKSIGTIYILLGLVLVVLAPVYSFTPTSLELQVANAATIPFGIPFGGMMLAIVPCLCSGGILGVVGPPAPGVFVLQPGVSLLFPFYQWRPGAWQLGLAAPGGVCAIPAPHSGCMVLPVEGTVIIDGTSL